MRIRFVRAFRPAVVETVLQGKLKSQFPPGQFEQVLINTLAAKDEHLFLLTAFDGPDLAGFVIAYESYQTVTVYQVCIVSEDYISLMPKLFAFLRQWADAMNAKRINLRVEDGDNVSEDMVREGGFTQTAVIFTCTLEKDDALLAELDVEIPSGEQDNTPKVPPIDEREVGVSA
jgi:hypothetical protein